MNTVTHWVVGFFAVIGILLSSTISLGILLYKVNKKVGKIWGSVDELEGNIEKYE
jgi:hypothetical protein